MAEPTGRDYLRRVAETATAETDPAIAAGQALLATEDDDPREWLRDMGRRGTLAGGFPW